MNKSTRRVRIPRNKFIHYMPALGAIRRWYYLTGVPRKSLVLTGPSGSGKTTLIQDFAARVGKPSLSLHLPAPLTRRTVILAMLDGLGQPVGSKHRQSTNSLHLSLVNMIRTRQIEFIALDDFQHLAHIPSRRDRKEITDWLVSLVNETQTPLLFISTNEKVVAIFNENRKLSRLVGYWVKLLPTSDDEDVAVKKLFRSPIQIHKKL